MKHSALEPIKKVRLFENVTLRFENSRSIHRQELMAQSNESAVEATAIIITAEHNNAILSGTKKLIALIKIFSDELMLMPAAFESIPK
jgi:hypothetical protein